MLDSEIELWMNDDNSILREKVARSRFTPTAEHVEQGLTDGSWSVRAAWAERRDFILTPEQVERGLTDSDPLVKRLFVQRRDFTPTPEQVERGLTDYVSLGVRVSWVQRMDFMPTSEQVERGLADEFEYVRNEWISRLKLEADSALNGDMDALCTSI